MGGEEKNNMMLVLNCKGDQAGHDPGFICPLEGGYMAFAFLNVTLSDSFMGNISAFCPKHLEWPDQNLQFLQTPPLPPTPGSFLYKTSLLLFTV